MRMKKSIIFGFVLAVIFMGFSACDDKNDTNPFDEPAILRLSDGSYIPLNVQYIRTEFSNYAEYPYPVKFAIISSTNELEQYFSKRRIMYPFVYDEYGNLLTDETFLNPIEQYSDNYFEDNFLVIVNLVEGSGSNRHKVESVDENGDISIKRLLPGPGHAGTADMAAWSIVIELNNEYKKEQYQIYYT